jgi:glutathione S-transferase
VAIKLYVVHGSHPCATVARALDIKGLDHEVVELPPPLHAVVQKALFGSRTVPAIRLDSGEKVSGSRAIVARLDELVPEPPLFPADERARASVRQADEWGDQVWQPIARRLLWWALTLVPDAMASYLHGSRLQGLPPRAVRAVAPVVSRAERALNGVDEGGVRADLRALPHHLDRIDGWIQAGVLGGEPVNAADLQIAASSRLLLTIGDVRPFFARRPAEAHARAVFAEWAGSAPPGAFPPTWLGEPQAAG